VDSKALLQILRHCWWLLDPTLALNALAAAATDATTATARAMTRARAEVDDQLLVEELFDQQNKTAFPGPADSEDEEDDECFEQEAR
jgi:hypothetical protein